MRRPSGLGPGSGKGRKRVKDCYYDIEVQKTERPDLCFPLWTHQSYCTLLNNSRARRVCVWGRGVVNVISHTTWITSTLNLSGRLCSMANLSLSPPIAQIETARQQALSCFLRPFAISLRDTLRCTEHKSCVYLRPVLQSAICQDALPSSSSSSSWSRLCQVWGALNTDVTHEVSEDGVPPISTRDYHQVEVGL